MESIETESNTRFAQNYIDSFFTKLPYDSRFNKVEYQKYVPVSGMSETVRQIEFVLERRDAPMCYMISDILLECNVTILEDTKTATLPATSLTVGPVNNVLHSLFETVIVKVNGSQITNSPDMYHYKTYLQSLLSYSSEIKNSAMQTVGYSLDNKRHMETDVSAAGIPTNSGFSLRANWFRKDNASTNAYRANGATFIGRLNHELIGSTKPLPPKSLVQITLNRAADDFFILKTSTDTKKYKAVISFCCLYVPIAWMQEVLLRELDVRWPKEPITYHYRRHNVLKLTVHRNKKEFFSDALFPESENPIRIYFFLVKADAAIGDQKLNPYNFGRSWEYTKDVARLSLQDQIRATEADQKMDEIKDMFKLFLQKFEQRDRELTAVAPPLPPTPPAPEQTEDAPLSARTRKGGPLKKSATPASASANIDLEAGLGGSGLQPPVQQQHSLFSSLTNLFRRGSQTVSEEEEFAILEPSPSLPQLQEASDLLLREIEKQRVAASNHNSQSRHGSVHTSIRPTGSVHGSTHSEFDALTSARQLAASVTAPEVSTFWLEKCQLELNSQPLG